MRYYTMLAFDTAGRWYCAGRKILKIVKHSDFDDAGLARCSVLVEDSRPLVVDAVLHIMDYKGAEGAGVPCQEGDITDIQG